MRSNSLMIRGFIQPTLSTISLRSASCSALNCSRVMPWMIPSRGRRQRKSIAIQRRQPIGLCNIVHGVGVEERVERRCRPCHGGEPEARGPAVDLSDVFDDKRMAEFFAQGDTP